MYIDRRWLAQFDWLLFGIGALIPLIGLVVLYSAGYDSEGSAFSLEWIPITIRSQIFVKQFVFLCIGFFTLLAGICIPPARLERSAYWIYTLCLLLLLTTLVVGVQANGARRWLALGGIRFQPSEFMKVGLILVMARYLSKHTPPPDGYGFRDLVAPFSLFLIPTALIMKQPDLGTALAVAVTGLVLVLFMGVRPKALAVMAALCIFTAWPAWNFLKPYQQRRVVAMFNPEADPLGSGYHIIQSKIAVGSGGLSGKGYLHGTQSQLQFIPEHTTDFIFSVLAEEWGFTGASFLLVIYFGFIYRLLRMAAHSRDLFPSLFTFGTAFLIFFHVIVNIGMVVGVLPVVGLPLPLVSYGGSAVITFLFTIGLVLGMHMRRHIFTVKS